MFHKDSLTFSNYFAATNQQTDQPTARSMHSHSQEDSHTSQTHKQHTIPGKRLSNDKQKPGVTPLQPEQLNRAQ